MASNVLLKKLSTFRGRPALESGLRDLGFTAHTVHQEHVFRRCGDQHRSAIDRYWNEMSYEYVATAAHAGTWSEGATRTREYRSPWLKELAASADYMSEPFMYADMLPCLYDYEVALDTGERHRRHAVVTTSKLAEHTGMPAKVGDRPLAQRDIANAFWAEAKYSGFTFVEGNLEVGAAEGLVVQSDAVGGFFPFPYETHVAFSLALADDRSQRFVLRGASMLVPGFAHYEVFNSREAAIHSVRACVAFALALAGAFGGESTRQA